MEKAVRSYRAGNQESFEKLYVLSYPYLYICVSHIIKDNNIIMDMMQETYLEISRSIFQLRKSEDFLKWASVIANRKCLAYLKKNNKIVLTADEDTDKEIFETIADDEAFIPEELFQNREKRRLIREIIDGLNEVQRLCVIGYYYNEQKQEEIAQELGIPVNTVKSHLNRAREKIKGAVLNLQEKKGTKLYCFTPFMLLYFAKEAGECKLAGVSERLWLDLQGGISGVGNKGETEKKNAVSSGVKFATWAIIGIFLAVMMMACGKAENYDSPERLDELLTGKTTVASAEPAWAEEASEQADDIAETAEPIEQPDWIWAYRDFLQDKENFRFQLGKERESGGYAGYITGFFLYDIDQNEIPELFVHKSYSSDFIYTYTDTGVELMYTDMYDNLSDSSFVYDSRDGQPYIFCRDVGTGTERTTGLARLKFQQTYYDTTQEMEWVDMWTAEWIYSAYFGDFEGDTEDSFYSIEWEDAAPNEGNAITKEEFMEVIENAVPFSYQKISERNIETYISADYRDIWDRPPLEEYMQSMHQEFDEFFRNQAFSETIWADDENIIWGSYGEISYVDMDNLVCYHITEKNIRFREEWKQIYWEWFHSDEFTAECEKWSYTNPWELTFWLVEWEGTETPILCMYIEDAIPWEISCYVIRNGAVKWLGWFGRAAMGIMQMTLISGGEYFLEYNVNDYIDSALCRMIGDEREVVWYVNWPGILEDSECPYDDTTKYIFMGNEMSREESMAQVDTLLGEGAAQQLLNLTLQSYGMEVQVEGPLIFHDTYGKDNDYECSQFSIMLNNAV